jgi:hypothetical protein
MLNVYRKMGYGDTLIVLLLMVAFLFAEGALFSYFPKLHFMFVHLIVVPPFVLAVRWMTSRNKKPQRNHLIDPVTGKPFEP